MNTTLELASALIKRPSVSPEDAGCQLFLADRLLALGFASEWFHCGQVSNVLFTHGQGEPSIWFLGHTDVVPSGPLEDWTSPPFEAALREGNLYGRGAADMKGAVAAIVIAVESLLQDSPSHAGQIGILLTSDEEGPALDGIRWVAEVLKHRNGAPQYCLVGEPSCQERLGDTVRIGRRGSIQAHLRIHGIQGHSAYPELLDNPIHRLAPFLAALTAMVWDEGDAVFPSTHCQVTNIQAGTGAENVTPGQAEARFNFRNSPASTSAEIKTRVEALLQQNGIENFALDWRVSGEAFCSRAGKLRTTVVRAIEQELDIQPILNTAGGTSDGRFLAPLDTEVVEFGLPNHSIHQVDEHVVTADLESLSRVYKRIISEILSI